MKSLPSIELSPWLAMLAWLFLSATLAAQPEGGHIYGPDFPKLDSLASGQWWKRGPTKRQPMPLLVPRDEVVAFTLYTHQDDQLKISAQLFPLREGEERRVRLEFLGDDQCWSEVATADVLELGWSAHFRITPWDNKIDQPFRVRHGKRAVWEGLIRKDPIEKDEIVVGNLSCNSSRTPGTRSQLVENLIRLNPDLLFFAGDQSYHHTQHTYGWLEFGMQFREVLKDRPVVTIPDDHDVGQANIWGENGKRATNSNGPSGGFFYPPKYVNQVQRCQTWHLPDPVEPEPIERNIGVYFTRLTVGGVDFAILEDRKFKSGPLGKIPKMGPRPDHINVADYDPKSIDLPGLKLLGGRQLKFLHRWGQDWTGTEMKCVLSQTAFCGAVHLHGNENNRLLADLDSNGWPQTGRNRALTEIRRAWATHLCGDQHLSVVVKHGIDDHRDGPYAFTSPAIVNTIYGRWWKPDPLQSGPHATAGPLHWTGDFSDGFGNKIHMMAYANPANRKDERQRGDGFGIARFKKSDRTITFEAWPRFCDVRDGDQAQYPGWPLTVRYRDNDGRKPIGWLPEIVTAAESRPVVQVIREDTGQIVYTVRAKSQVFRPAVYAAGTYTVKVGRNKPDLESFPGLSPAPLDDEQQIQLHW